MIHVEFKKHDRTYVLTIPLNTNRELYRMILCFHLIPIESCIE